MALLGKRNRATATINAVNPSGQDVIPAASGYTVVLTSVVAVNNENYNLGITLLEESVPLAPQVVLGASGTFIWDDPGGDCLWLTTGSGVKAYVGSDGSMEVTAYYILRDDRTPETKAYYRNVTFVASNRTTATRTPNQFGGQQLT